MNPQITLEERTFEDANGRDILRITPVLTVRPYGSGEIRLASWEAWADDPAEIAKQRENAMSTAKQTVGIIAIKISQQQP